MFTNAKQCLPSDTNIEQSNKQFLSNQIEKFEKEGEKWKKTGSMTEK